MVRLESWAPQRETMILSWHGPPAAAYTLITTHRRSVFDGGLRGPGICHCGALRVLSYKYFQCPPDALNKTFVRLESDEDEKRGDEVHLDHLSLMSLTPRTIRGR